MGERSRISGLFEFLQQLTMNALEKFIIREKINPVEAMNRLHDDGIISDLAINPADVATENIFDAMQYLKKWLPCSLCGEYRSKCQC